jgi:hypothetical protein
VSPPSSTFPSAEWIALRKMPTIKGAPESMLRVTSILSVNAQTALANALSMRSGEIPLQFAIWFDMIDDAAMIVTARHDDAKQRDGWRRMLAKIGSLPQLAQLGLAPSIAAGRYEQRGQWGRLSLTIPPGALRRAIARVGSTVTNPTPSDDMIKPRGDL